METVIITGANGNIGSIIAEKLLEKGNNVVLIYNKNKHRINPLLEKYSQQASAVQCDIKIFSSIEAALDNEYSSGGRLPKALIHTAALRSIDHSPLSESDQILWKEVIETNVMGTYNVLKAAIRCFQKAKNNTAKSKKNDPFYRIVLLGSDVSRIGLPYGSAYAASKAAVSNITRSLSVELGKDMILINTISPGPVKIDDSHFSNEYREFRKQYYRNMLERIPLQRIATPQDIAGLALYLMSDENTYITGEEIFVTGGKV